MLATGKLICVQFLFGSEHKFEQYAVDFVQFILLFFAVH